MMPTQPPSTNAAAPDCPSTHCGGASSTPALPGRPPRGGPAAGALLPGTRVDGFGMTADETERIKRNGYRPGECISASAELAARLTDWRREVLRRHLERGIGNGHAVVAGRLPLR